MLKTDFLQKKSACVNTVNMLKNKMTVYPGGKKKEYYSLVDGKFHGLYEMWYPSGQKKCEIMYDHGIKNGFLRIWYESGQMQFEIPYVNGKVHGFWRKWYENGTIETEVSYIHGEEKFMLEIDGKPRMFT